MHRVHFRRASLTEETIRFYYSGVSLEQIDELAKLDAAASDEYLSGLASLDINNELV